jgi:predicted anti-sigma-YlaC factor YlaD
VIGHLGTRVSALLDGQLSAEETERAWEHVHACHSCRDLVEREGWVKTRLAGLSFDSGCAPDHLKGSLLGMPPCEVFLGLDSHRSRRAGLGLAAIGGGAVGAAVMGVLALGAAPADAPSIERRVPVTQLVTPSPQPMSVPSRRP